MESFTMKWTGYSAEKTNPIKPNSSARRLRIEALECKTNPIAAGVLSGAQRSRVDLEATLSEAQRSRMDLAGVLSAVERISLTVSGRKTRIARKNKPNFHPSPTP
jgi:hypothetical protein